MIRTTVLFNVSQLHITAIIACTVLADYCCESSVRMVRLLLVTRKMLHLNRSRFCLWRLVFLICDSAKRLLYCTKARKKKTMGRPSMSHMLGCNDNNDLCEVCMLLWLSFLTLVSLLLLLLLLHRSAAKHVFPSLSFFLTFLFPQFSVKSWGLHRFQDESKYF